MLGGLQLKKLAPRTVRGIRAVFRAALSDAVRWGLVGRNAAALAYPPKAKRPELRVLSAAAESRTLLNVALEDRLEALFSLGIACGLRLGAVRQRRAPR